MAVFGFLVFLCATLGVSIIGLAVFTWPSYKTFTGERLFVGAVVGIMWAVVYINNPFSVTITG